MSGRSKRQLQRVEKNNEIRGKIKQLGTNLKLVEPEKIVRTGPNVE
jgi:hypothetical protein